MIYLYLIYLDCEKVFQFYFRIMFLFLTKKISYILNYIIFIIYIMIIIPIGVDCGNAEFLKRHNLRNFSLPFDWLVTYNGISNIIKNDFNGFIPGPTEIFVPNYDTLFLHNNFPEDNETMIRRINRFKNILETTYEKVVFVRKGHAFHHHNEQNNRFNIIKSDIQDAEDLDVVLKEKYPNLNFEIIVILVCGKCFHSDEKYESASKNIKIYNISTPAADDFKYNNLCLEVFIKKDC